MKKFIALFALFISVMSCSIDDGINQNFQFEILPIESVSMPDQFILGEPAQITLTYVKPTGCHVFNEFYYVSELNQRTVAIVTTVYNNDCDQNLNASEDVSFEFLPSSPGTYVFRFWQGVDDSGLDSYFIVEVPVAE